MLGGTFNPPHLGHLALAAFARAELGLERIVLMPAHSSPHKGGAPDPGAHHRLRMCELAAAVEDGVQACALEIERGGTSYTVDTLRRIEARHPHAELTFIVGADVAAGLPSWREPGEIARLARLAIVTRPGADRELAAAAVAAVVDAAGTSAGATAHGGPDRVRFLAMPPVAVSSSLVRERVAAGEPVDALVPAPVAAYIAEHGLYGAAPTAGAAAGGTGAAR